ncbi:MAG: hypothetical protein ACLRK6_07185 [Anaerostipes hadrus]
MMIENRKNFYTLICAEWSMYGGGIIIHTEVNVGSVIEAHEYVLSHLYDFPTGTWILKPCLTAIN